MADLPPELVAKPLALIGVMGLDITSNPVHRSIWDAFSNNRRTDGVPVRFKLLNDNHAFPMVKPKRNSYEWYIPKGILKRNWMPKYLHEIPSIVAVFYDLDWNDATWNDKKIECASRVQSLRAVLDGRSTKIAVVLIQHCAPPPPDAEDVVATERAAALCGACELPAKMLYALPHGDHLLGYVSRLESALYELSRSFYYHEYHVVKAHRDQLNKTTHQYLFVRHQFKMGFLNELRQDQHIAYKHYSQAYNHILDIRIVDTNAMEVKTVASFINYKLCRLMFKLNRPKDAIGQFRGHTDRFKLRTGPKELAFEHHAWMSAQFSTFAELFDEAIRQGLSAVSTQHPGYYFQLAAQHATLRKSACRELCDVCSYSSTFFLIIYPVKLKFQKVNYPDPDPLADQDKLEFYGQRPWRPGKLSAEPADAPRELAAIQALQYKEKTVVNHSDIIIGLLGNAITQFLIFRCPRMRRYLVAQMADEYYNCMDYGKVLTLLMHMLWEYRSERWPVLLTDVLKNGLRAAYLMANIQDYLTLALEALGPGTLFSEVQRSLIFENILNILRRKVPNPEVDLPENSIGLSMEKWTAELNRPEPLLFTIDDNNMATFVEVKARFTEGPLISVDSVLIVEVFVRNLHLGAAEFSKCTVTVAGAGYSSEFRLDDGLDWRDSGSMDTSLKIASGETKKRVCSFRVPKQPSGTELQITSVSLYLGDEKSYCVVLRFSATNGESNLLDRLYPEIQQLRGGEFAKVKPVTSIQIKAQESSVDVVAEAKAPSLLVEWLPINISVSSAEEIHDARLTVSLLAQDPNDEHSTDLSLDMINKLSTILVDLKAIKKDKPVQETIYVRSHKIGDRKFLMKVEYSTIDRQRGAKELIYTLPVNKPFDVATRFYTTLFETMNKGFVNESFILMPRITCLSPWPITIISTSIKLGDSLVWEKEEPKNSTLEGVILHDGETAAEAVSLVPKVGSEQPVSIGVYTIKWKRANSPGSLETSSSVTLSPLKVEDVGVGLEVQLPAHGWVCTPLYVSYFIRNHTNYLITLRSLMIASDAFMFSGHKHVDVYLLPHEEHKIEWILRPLVPGFVALPTLSLTVAADDEHKINGSRLAEVLERSQRSHVYIMPQLQSVEIREAQ
ncbi:trafficking protein particle complex subunit 11 isoform X2 [Orussus abietinus]|uniref:trafficking protein particle complex subunit 11 isoform X2 n=1 Tax=Orussus abietinus TaxID=222816 RepID=UPI000C715BE1|nr:trafficking protein particle complex subunit 11 isoform X2 [Orussus abietinus]